MRPLSVTSPTSGAIPRTRANTTLDPAAERARRALEAGADGDALDHDGLADDADTRARVARLLALEGDALTAAFAASSDPALAALGRHLERHDAPGSGLSRDERADLHAHLARQLDDPSSSRWQALLPPAGASEYAFFAAAHRSSPGGEDRSVSTLARLDREATLRFRPTSDTRHVTPFTGGPDADIAALRSRALERLSSDPGGFGAAVRLAFGDKAGTPAGRSLLAEFADGTRALPTVRVVEPGSLGSGVRGAYDPSGDGTILIERSVLVDRRRAEAVLLEEFGHHLDALLGGADSLGDEGAVFARSLLYGAPSDATLTALRRENDHGHVLLDGRRVAVELDRGPEPDIGRAPNPPIASAGAEPTADALETLRSERYELYLHAVESFPEPPSAGVRHALATAAADVAVALQRFRDGEIGRGAFVDELNDANNLFAEHTGRALIGPRSRRGRLTVTYNGSNVPDHLKGSGNRDDLLRTDWRTTADLVRTTDAKAKTYGRNLHEALLRRGNVRDLDYLADNGGLPRAGVDVLESLAPLAERSHSGFDPSDESSDHFHRFSEGLETVVRLQSEADPDSEGDWRRVYEANFDLAALLLTGDSSSLTRQDFRHAYAWITGDSLRDLGYRHTFWGPDPLEPNRGNNVQQPYPGGYGNFGRAKYEFALSVLRSDKSERLRIFGFDETAWNRAEGFIAGGNQARARARAIDDARFGFDDVVKIGIGAAFVYAGVAAPGVLGAGGGFFASGAGASIGTGIGAGLSGFGLNFALTGDIESSLESGAIAGLTAGLADYARGFDGTSRTVVEALTRGVTEELTGGQFIDGVLASVVDTYGERYETLLADKSGPFVAGLTAVVVETAVRERGDLSGLDDLIEAYVRDYAEGLIQSRMTEVLGEESEVLAGAFAGLASRAIDGNGRLDTDAMVDYLRSPAFLGAIGNDAGRRVTDWFGGPERFRAALLGDLTNLLIATGGDADRIASGIEAIGMDMAARYASGQVTSALAGDVEEPGALALAVGDLVRIGIGSGFDATTMRTYAYGTVLEHLVERGGDALTASFGGTGRFMSGLLAELVRSVERNGGDLEAVTRDLALWMARSPAYGDGADEAGVADASLVAPAELRTVLADALRAGGRPTAGVSGLASGHPAVAAARLAVGDTGADVRAVERRLAALGYDPGAVDDGRYDAWSGRATAAFASDQLVLLDRLAIAYTDHSPDSREADVVAQAHAELAAEVAASRMGRWTAALLDATLSEDTVVAIERALVDADPFDPVEEPTTAPASGGIDYGAPSLDLPIERTLSRGDTGADVTALQRRLNALRPSTDAALVPDGEFGPLTGDAAATFQRSQLELLRTLDAAYDVHAPEDEDGGAIRTAVLALDAELGRGVVGPATLGVLETPMTAAAIDRQIAVLDGRADSPDYIAGEIGRVVAEDGVLDVALLGGRRLTQRQMREVSELLGRADGDLAEVVRRLESDDITVIAANVDRLSATEQTAFLEHLAEHLTDGQLGTFALRLNEPQQAAFAHAIGRAAPPDRREAFVAAMREARSRERRSELDGLTQAQRTVVMDALQLGLDVAGIFDPTILSDGANTLISLARGNLFDAAISAISLLPLGDAAKLLKIDGYLRKLEKAIDLASKSVEARRHIEPLLDGLRRTVEPLRGRGGVFGDKVEALLSRLDAPAGTSVHRSGRPGDGANPVLNQRTHERLPDHVYEVDGRTRYHTDERGRVTSMDATITRESIADRPARNENSQSTIVSTDGIGRFDEGGHLLSHANGGAGERINLVPLEGALNQGQRDVWRDMEDFITREAGAGREVRMVMDLDYDAHDLPNRPTAISVTVYVDGRPARAPYSFDNLRPPSTDD